MPFRYHDHTIRIAPCSGRHGLYFAEVFGPSGYEYGPVGVGFSRLQAQKSAFEFVRDVRAIAGGTFFEQRR